MHPELFHLRYLGLDRPIYSYGVMMLAGATAAILLGWRRASRHAVVPFDVVAVGLLTVLGGVVGAWLLFVAIHWHEFVAAPLAYLRQPGLVFYGGFAGAFGVAWIYIRGYGVPPGGIVDIAASALPFGHAFGRVGCFLGGCCYGRPTRSALGVTFTDPRTPATTLCHLAGPIHPVQLYEAAGLLAITAIVLVVGRTPRRPGSLFVLYLALYAALRLVTEQFRGDFVERGYFVPGILTTSQTIGVAMLALSGGLYVYLRRKGRPA
jgi:phosphatidylglycerol:prolipoprotein diacylglycerol transferase